MNLESLNYLKSVLGVSKIIVPEGSEIRRRVAQHKVIFISDRDLEKNETELLNKMAAAMRLGKKDFCIILSQDVHELSGYPIYLGKRDQPKSGISVIELKELLNDPSKKSEVWKKLKSVMKDLDL
jgi:hypothetical protein